MTRSYQIARVLYALKYQQPLQGGATGARQISKLGHLNFSYRLHTFHNITPSLVKPSTRAVIA